jgi:hypothetical protein
MSQITEQELKQLQEQEQKKGAIIHDLGVLEVQKHSLLHAFALIQSEQEESKKQLEEKYGKINVDLKDGTYTEIVEEAEAVEE